MSQEVIITDSPTWQEYKELRLKGLQTDPKAFSSVYREQVNYPDCKWQERLAASKAGYGTRMLFARVDSKLAGMVGATWENSAKTGHWAYIISMYVDPEYRGLRISSKLLDALEEDLKKRGPFRKYKLDVVRDQTAAVELYKSRGYQVVGIYKDDLRENGEYCDVLAMEKYLV